MALKFSIRVNGVSPFQFKMRHHGGAHNSKVLDNL
jgi:hypothetical protein